MYTHVHVHATSAMVDLLFHFLRNIQLIERNICGKFMQIVDVHNFPSKLCTEK